MWHFLVISALLDNYYLLVNYLVLETMLNSQIVLVLLFVFAVSAKPVEFEVEVDASDIEEPGAELVEEAAIEETELADMVGIIHDMDSRGNISKHTLKGTSLGSKSRGSG